MAFNRGYMEDFSAEIFTISKVLTNLPVPQKNTIGRILLELSSKICLTLFHFAQLCSTLFKIVQFYSTLLNFVKLWSTLLNFVQICSTLRSYAQILCLFNKDVYNFNKCWHTYHLFADIRDLLLVSHIQFSNISA